MRAELYEAIAEKYTGLNAEFSEQAGPSCRFKDISPNLVMGLNHLANELKNPDLGDEVRKDVRRDFGEYRRALETYFKLLNQHNFFMDSEFNHLGGHFPEFGSYGTKKPAFDCLEAGFVSPKTHYVSYAKEKLSEITGE